MNDPQTELFPRSTFRGVTVVATRVAPEVEQGPRPLTARELTVLQALAVGETRAETARRLAISVRAVKQARNRVYVKFGVSAPAQAVAAGFQEGYLR